MKQISPALREHLETGGPFLMTDLYTITLVSGLVFRWADYDTPISHDGWTFSSTGPILRRSKTRCVIGVEVDTLDISICPRPADTVDGLPMLAAAHSGSFDGATIKLERAFLTHPATVIGAIILFVGRAADLTISRTELQMRVNSPTEALNCKLPRNIYDPACWHLLYADDCTVQRVLHAQGSVAMSGSTDQVIYCGLMSGSLFDRGYIEVTSGDLAGTRRTIKSSANGEIRLFLPLPTAIGIGESFIAYPGCNRSLTDCVNKFGNKPNFRATPLIPSPETAI